MRFKDVSDDDLQDAVTDGEPEAIAEALGRTSDELRVVRAKLATVTRELEDVRRELETSAKNIHDTQTGRNEERAERAEAALRQAMTTARRLFSDARPPRESDIWMTARWEAWHDEKDAFLAPEPPTRGGTPHNMADHVAYVHLCEHPDCKAETARAATPAAAPQGEPVACLDCLDCDLMCDERCTCDCHGRVPAPTGGTPRREG